MRIVRWRNTRCRMSHLTWVMMKASLFFVVNCQSALWIIKSLGRVFSFPVPSSWPAAPNHITGAGTKNTKKWRWSCSDIPPPPWSSCPSHPSPGVANDDHVVLRSSGWSTCHKCYASISQWPNSRSAYSRWMLVLLTHYEQLSQS